MPENSSTRSINNGFTLVLTLFFLNLCGYLDRQILSLLVDPIKKSLSLSDTSIGLIQGLAFVATYSILGLFAGKLVDGSSRKNLLLASVCIWTLATACSGLARSGTELFIARMFVGAGEAALIPAAASLIADSVSEQRRSLALGTFLTGVHLGIGLSLMLVGALLPPLTQLSEYLLDAGYLVEPWRIVMGMMIVPGALCCVLLMFIREPERRARVKLVTDLPEISASGEWKRRLSIYLPQNLGVAATGLCLFATSAWFPTMLIRDFNADPRWAGITYGMIVAATGLIGALASGQIADRLIVKYGISGQLAVVLFAAPVAAGCFLIIALQWNLASLLFAAALLNMMLVSCWAMGLTSMSNLAPAYCVGRLIAIMLLFNAALGNGLGPALVGMISDHLHPFNVPLGRILGLVGFASALLIAFFYSLTIMGVRREKLRFTIDAQEAA